MDVQLRKWTRVEYERLVEAEILGPDDRVELLGGAMICKEPSAQSARNRRAARPACPDGNLWSGLGRAAADARGAG